ncbi:MAG: 4-phosphoerythronate dehydrogenase [Bacteroidota bacterium]|nr:4-phosphoerythronate dehydrogenase [Bacteroidota bacterium]
MKIVIDDKIPFIRGAFERWADVVYSPGSRIDARTVADADALIVRTRTKCNAGLLEGSSVRIVASATIGFDHIDTGWMEAHGIKWANAPGCNSGSVMQYITSLLFFLARKHSLDLRTLTLGIVGVGNVGSKVERVARALGMRVLLNDPPRERREGGPETNNVMMDENRGSVSRRMAGSTRFYPLDKLLEESDILTLHVPLTREGEDKTFHLMDARNLSRMKRNAILINSSRGEVVDNPALREALKTGLLRGAALDVWEGEPAADPELVDLADIATPHIAGYSVDGKANATVSSVRTVAAHLGLPMHDWVPSALPQPSRPAIDLTGPGGATPLDLVAQAVLHTYPIEEDDHLFRNGKENFEYLRDNYRIRREFGSYSIRTGNADAARILSEIGFQIIK